MMNRSSDRPSSFDRPDHDRPNPKGISLFDQTRLPQPITDVLAQLRAAIWWIGLPTWLFGAADRGVAAVSDGHLASNELLQILMIAFLFISWLTLKPESLAADEELDDWHERDSMATSPDRTDLCATQERMEELADYHLIHQSYTLPFPHLCQIYHLLNLKHLESIHSFSLNNLKVLNVTHLEKTDRGGMIKFQTILDSPWNVLRIWRQSIAEVQLTLLTPYTVELSIPVYDDKVITILFNAIPIHQTKHQFTVDIYSNLEWYKPILKVLLHFASTLTLIEDLPYLRLLAQKDIHRSTNADRFKNHDMMWLYGRFLSLYGSSTPALALSESSS